MADQAQNKNPREQSATTPESQSPAENESGQGPELRPLGEEQEVVKPAETLKAGETPAVLEQATSDAEQGIPSLQQQPAQSSPPALPKSKMRKRIEVVMAEDLSELYQHMDAPTKAAFKTQAKVVASRIEELIATAKVRARDVIELIRGWLCIIPGMNKFFLEQETKIKADKIADIAMNKHKYQ